MTKLEIIVSELFGFIRTYTFMQQLVLIKYTVISYSFRTSKTLNLSMVMEIKPCKY